MRIVPLVAVVLAIACTAAPATSEAQDFCLEIAKRGLFDKYAGTTFNAGYAQSQSAYCRRFNETKSSKTDVGIGYGDFSLDFSNKDARSTAELVCSSKFDEEMFQQSAASMSRVLGTNAVEAIRACANKTGLIVKPRFEGEDLVVVDMAYLPMTGEAKPVRQITERVRETGAITCKGKIVSAFPKTPTIDQNNLSMTCTRKASAAKVIEGKYGKATVTPGGTATIFTNDRSVTVSLPAKVDGPGCAPQPVVFPAPATVNNLCTDNCLSYGAFITDTKAASAGGNAALRQLTYNVTVPNCGDYKLVAKYAMSTSRPVQLVLDGTPIATPVLARTNGSHTSAAEYVELLLPLRAGQHTFRLQRQGAFPHLQSLELQPL